MRGVLLAVLCCRSVSVGVAFAAPSATFPLQREGLRGGSSSSNSRSSSSSGVFLFSPEHGDHDGPIVRVSSSKKTADKKVVGKPRGGWGTWKKEVSQRVEQNEVLERFTAEGGIPAEASLAVRTVNKSDMLGISRLCIDTFRGPFQWFELPLQLFQEFAFFGQIQGRLGRVTRNEIKHSMVIVEDTTSSKVVGFLEIGMLPKPSSSEESAMAGEALTAARASAAVAAATAAARASGEKADGDPSPSSSSSATASLDAGGAEEVAGGDAGEGDEIVGGSDTTAIRREEQPDVAYLANVVVDRRQRRRGIGRTMVRSAFEIVRELWPAEESIYVSVEQGNDIALALYQGMGFELTALEDEMMARSRRRPPRVYLSKPVSQ
ncbi:unnamed protein product [Scytosiphon promiscuus]